MAGSAMSLRRRSRSSPASDAACQIAASLNRPRRPIRVKWKASYLSWRPAASEARAATIDSGPRIGNSFSTQRTLPSPSTSSRIGPTMVLQ